MSPRPICGSVRIRRALALAGCGVASIGLSACESTERESAKIGRESAAAARAEASESSARTHAAARAHGRGHRSAHGAAHKGSTAP
ncbi:MAG TPA: hypothetical protein VK778_11420 [Solirubrobacteraceae bacterium]|jgi:hypothetical protein|nr:hypothetical protein [Solirubrobacteraceae bacterium]